MSHIKNKSYNGWQIASRLKGRQTLKFGGFAFNSEIAVIPKQSLFKNRKEGRHQVPLSTGGHN